MAKRFMYVCLGVLPLAIAFHLGGRVAISLPSYGEAKIFAVDQGHPYVMDDTGQIYDYDPTFSAWLAVAQWPGNPPSITEPATWGKVKAEFSE